MSTIAHRPATSLDNDRLPPFLRKVLFLFIQNNYEALNSAALRQLSGTKHVTRRITELQDRGFQFVVSKSGGQNVYRYTGNVRSEQQPATEAPATEAPALDGNSNLELAS